MRLKKNSKNVLKINFCGFFSPLFTNQLETAENIEIINTVFNGFKMA